MSRPSPTVSVMMDAARAAGRKLIRDFGEVENLQVSRKGPADFVSETWTKPSISGAAEMVAKAPNFVRRVIFARTSCPS